MSRAFKFRLEAAILRRAQVERDAQSAFALTVREGRAAQATLDTLCALAAEGRRDDSTPGTAIDPLRRMNLLLFVDQAGQKVRRQEQVVAERKRAAELAQEALRQAAARRRALERLRERRLEEFTAEERLRVERELDEQTTLRYARTWV